MQHSDFLLRSVLEVRFNFFTYVSESEFQARSIWAHYRPPIQNLKCPKTLKMHARTLISPHPSEVKPELCRLCTSSPIPICVGRHYYSWSTLNWVLYLHCTVICDHQSWKWTENWIISSSKHAKGRTALPKRMNFWKSSKRPLIPPPPSFSENHVALFFRSTWPKKRL